MQLAFAHRGFHYHRCPNCRLISTYPLPDSVTIEAHYARRFRQGNYQLLQSCDAAYRRVYLDTIRHLKQRLRVQGSELSGQSALDVGCFTGGFLFELAKEGVDVHGIELQTEAVRIANQRLGGRVVQADILAADHPVGRYDIVSLLGVVEHVIDPIKLLRRCYAALKPGGLFLLQTPNSGSALARILGRYWPPYAPVEHIHIFSKRALGLGLAAAGFEGLTWRRQFKRLPIDYVFQMTRFFGPELHALSAPIYRLVPGRLKEVSLPFYVGGLTMTARKPATQQAKRG